LTEKTTILLWPLLAVVKYDQVVLAALTETPLSLIIFSLRSPPMNWICFQLLKPKNWSWVCLVFSLSSLHCAAQETPNAQALYQRSHASICLSCHTLTSLSKVRDKEVFVNQLIAFQNSPRKDRVMSQIARGLSNAQLTELAYFFTQQEGPDL
jgi:cytochrome c553